MPSVEEKVEEYFKKILDANKVRHYGKTEKMNPAIASALKNADSKSGGSGCNFPDIQMMLENSNARRIPVMVEAKGTKNKLEKRDKSGVIVGVTYYDKDGRPGKETSEEVEMPREYFVCELAQLLRLSAHTL